MLDLSRYLLGVAEIALLAGFAWLGASAVRSRLLSDFTGAPAHLATAVLALALLIWAAEILGTFGLFELVPYLLVVAVAGLGLRAGMGKARERAGRSCSVAMGVGLAIAAVAIVKFGLDVKPKLPTGMTGFDSTWYHGPFAAGFFQSGDTWDLHFIAPQFLAWFYPANAEIFHSVGMLAFDWDILSPLVNLGWFVGCLVACWCIGRPYGVAPWSLALGAIALSVPAFADQAGEARNDIVGTFFLLAAVAIALNTWSKGSVRVYARISSTNANSAIVAGLAAGLAAGTKLNFLLPAAVLVVGLAMTAPLGQKWRSLAVGGLAGLAGGGYWYLRNLVHTGNPLPWVDSIGPVSLPAPDQALGGREGHSVLGYLFDGAVWSDWFLPGLHDGLWIVWPSILGLAFGGLVLCLSQKASPALRVAGAVGLAAALAWLIAPTSASGPEGMSRGFESGLRYLAPALVLGLALLPVALLPRVARWRGSPMAEGARSASEHMGEGRRDRPRGPRVGAAALVLLVVIAIGYPVQRHYLENRYASPSFTTPGLNAAFKWSRSVSDARIATTSTRQYPLYGTDLSNHVDFIGEEQPHGGFTAPTTCQQWRRLLNEGAYDYVVTSRDRIEPGKPPYPPTAAWTADPSSQVVLREPPSIVFQLSGPLDPSACSR
ncbi:MAG TPA: hypothetical protein VNP96_10545 [Solirubrobacterales bacterium]|nr:hypothetical protein [Solirubrobacterales bacterium]